MAALVAYRFLSGFFLQLILHSFVLSTNLLWSLLLTSADKMEKWKHSSSPSLLWFSLHWEGGGPTWRRKGRTFWLGISEQHLCEAPHPNHCVLLSAPSKKRSFLLTCPRELPLVLTKQEDLFHVTRGSSGSLHLHVKSLSRGRW